MGAVGERWGEARGIEILGTSRSPLTTEIVAAYYLDRIDEGEGVAPDTANKELLVWSQWHDLYIENLPGSTSDGSHPVKNRIINDLKMRAKLWYQKGAEPKEGYLLQHVESFWGNGAITGRWEFDHTRLCLGVMFFFLARSIAAAHIIFRGDAAGPIADIDSDVRWGFDEQYGSFMNISFQRDKTIRNRQTSERFLPEDNGTKIGLYKFVRDYIRHYRMPSGTYLLAHHTHDGRFGKTPFTNWGRVTDRICSSIGLDRSAFGTQSCRRGCAEWLNQQGIDFEHVGLLGHWLSDVVRRYTGIQAAPRLATWDLAKQQALCSKRS